jgi:mannose-6-phosphate isomerase-like protein (cupin superfamily)
MIFATPDVLPMEHAVAHHQGKGPFARRTLLENIPGSAFKHIREVVLPPGSIIGDHPHVGDDELYYILSGVGVMVVNGEERVMGPGSAALVLSGGTHGLRNEGSEDVRILIVCAQSRSV